MRCSSLKHDPSCAALALVGEVGELAEIFQWRTDAGCEPGLPKFSPEDKVGVSASSLVANNSVPLLWRTIRFSLSEAGPKPSIATLQHRALPLDG